MIKLHELNKCKKCNSEPKWSAWKGVYCPCNNFSADSNGYVYYKDHPSKCSEEHMNEVHENHLLNDKIVVDIWNKENSINAL